MSASDPSNTENISVIGQITNIPENPSRIAEVAGVAVAEGQSQKTAEIIILDAVRAGNRRHGPASRASGLGTTNGYNEIERLRSTGKLHCAKDGLLPGTG